MIDEMTPKKRKEEHKRAMRRLGRPQKKLFAEQIHFNLNAKNAEKLRAAAWSESKSIAQYCRDLVAEKIKEEKK
jgi:hypothetical protein